MSEERAAKVESAAKVFLNVDPAALREAMESFVKSVAAAPAVPAVEVMTLREAAAYLRVDPKTMTKMLKSGRVPGRRMGDMWRFHRSALQKFLCELEPAPSAPRRRRKRAAPADGVTGDIAAGKS